MRFDKRCLTVVPALAAVVVTLSACGLSLSTKEPALVALEKAEARWERTRPDDYEYAVRRNCFCIAEASLPARLTVDGDRVIGIVYVSSGEAVPAPWAELYPTVDRMFEILRDALERRAADLQVTYDEDTGVPMSIWIDYRTEVADEELGFQVVEAPRPPTGS